MFDASNAAKIDLIALDDASHCTYYTDKAVLVCRHLSVVWGCWLINFPNYERDNPNQKQYIETGCKSTL